MAGQARREHQGQGQSSRAGSEWPVIAGVSGAASGSVTAITTAPASPASTEELPTQSTYRNLLIRGLAPDEAANLTAYLAGIPIGESSWTLRQINQLLFLRQMNRTGAFADLPEPRPH